MILSGQLPFDQNALPAWMYHAQVPPPKFEFNAQLPGITWVDLVFPFFLFSMGAAFPLALHRRMAEGTRKWQLGWFVAERGLLLAFFALFVELIRPYVLSKEPTFGVWFQALLGFFLLFCVLTRFPRSWSRELRMAIRGVGWLGVVLFCALTKYPDGGGFSLHRSDIIIVVLANMAVFGSLVWMFTRENLLLRLGVLGIVFAVRMSNLPGPTQGWVHELWQWSPVPWIYRLYYLQYLCVVIPGTIAGDLILRWMKAQSSRGPGEQGRARSSAYDIGVMGVMICLPLLLLVGLKTRWLVGTTIGAFGLCIVGLLLFRKALNPTEALYKSLFQWATYWLILGLVFEPYEGGIKKDHPTLSYYFVTSGLAIFVFILFSIVIDVARRKSWVRLLIDNGQNPMIAYAGINNFSIPVLHLTGLLGLLNRFASSPWLGFCKGVFITAFTAVFVSLLTRLRIFWRT